MEFGQVSTFQVILDKSDSPTHPDPFLKDMDHLFYDDNDANYVGDNNYDGADVDDDDDGDGD